jgi:hypothetical protein
MFSVWNPYSSIGLPRRFPSLMPARRIREKRSKMRRNSTDFCTPATQFGRQIRAHCEATRMQYNTVLHRSCGTPVRSAKQSASQPDAKQPLAPSRSRPLPNRAGQNLEFTGRQMVCIARSTPAACKTNPTNPDSSYAKTREVG